MTFGKFQQLLSSESITDESKETERLTVEKVCYRGLRECAEALGISRDTLTKIVKNDPSFPVIKTGPNNSIRLFPVQRISEWVATQAGSRVIVDPAFDDEDYPEPTAEAAAQI